MKRAAVRTFCLLALLALLLSNPVTLAATTNTLALTAAEMQFIEQHPVIKLGVDPKFLPYEFFDTDGVYKGIAADYIELIRQKTGLQMVPAENLTWTEAYEKAVRKELDVLPCVSKTAERQEYFSFSNAYITFQRVIFVSKDNTDINSFEDLSGGRVAVQTNSSHHSYLKEYPEIELSLYPTVEAALQAVSDGQEKAFVGNLATSSYLITKAGITNLKYIPIASEEPQSLYFAVRNDWPELVGIINKALTSISEADKIAINNKWIGVTENTNYQEIIRIASLVGIIIAAMMVVSIFWIIRLKREIVKRQKTQLELRAAKEDAERFNETKSMFLARMSHEIRTPLNAIMGMAYLIRKTELDETQTIYIDKLTQAARDMLGLINDILDFSKIEAGKIEIEKVPFNLEKTVQRLINMISVSVDSKNLELHLEIDPQIPESLLGDPARIEQILLNLLSNAIKFTDAGSVQLTVQIVSQIDKTYRLAFRVKDTGIGMSQEQIARIFLPFDQGDSSINRRFGGTGLGLSIVKSLVSMMDGTLEVDSTVGEGSSFLIGLDFTAISVDENADSRKRSSEWFKKIRAIIFDKNESDQITIAEYLKSFGIKSLSTDVEADVFNLLTETNNDSTWFFDLVIIDYATPEEDVVDFCRHVKALQTGRPTPALLLMVPMAKEDLMVRLKQEGLAAILVKPIMPSALFDNIIELFDIEKIVQTVAAADHDEVRTPHPYHLLLVEDNKTNQYIAQVILENAGFKVSIADNGQIGYDSFKNNPGLFDLILMDIQMPVMNGYQSADLIRQLNRDIPIVAMTADAISGINETCRQHGINYYVSKPFEPVELIETIMEILKGKLPGYAEPQAAAVDIVLLDEAAGLKLLGGDRAIYREILKTYRDENLETGVNLQKYLDTGDIEQAVQLVHRIKSSSGNIGAGQLFEVASGLQSALRDRKMVEIPERVKAFQDILQKLLFRIDETINE